MKTHSLILIQEHWLHPDDLFKLSKLNDDFLCLASSAMGQRVSQNILVGRPFGGVGILYNQHLIKNITCVFRDSRVIIAAIGKTLIVNIYLPNCIIKDDYVLELQDIFASIGNVIDNYAGFDVIVAGDFNFQFVSDNIGFQHLDKFMAEFHLGSCDYLLKTPPDYTFHIEKLGYRSFIDHFVCSSHLITKVDSLHILDSGCNLSDHLAISLCVCSDNFLPSHPSGPDQKCNDEANGTEV